MSNFNTHNPNEISAKFPAEDGLSFFVFFYLSITSFIIWTTGCRIDKTEENIGVKEFRRWNVLGLYFRLFVVGGVVLPQSKATEKWKNKGDPKIFMVFLQIYFTTILKKGWILRRTKHWLGSLWQEITDGSTVIKSTHGWQSWNNVDIKSIFLSRNAYKTTDLTVEHQFIKRFKIADNKLKLIKFDDSCNVCGPPYCIYHIHNYELKHKLMDIRIINNLTNDSKRYKAYSRATKVTFSDLGWANRETGILFY